MLVLTSLELTVVGQENQLALQQLEPVPITPTFLLCILAATLPHAVYLYH